MSKASLNFRLFTVSVNSSTKPGGIAALMRKSRARRTTSASIATEMANSSGPNTQPSDLIMNITSSVPLICGLPSAALATLANRSVMPIAIPALNRNRAVDKYRVDWRVMLANPGKGDVANGLPSEPRLKCPVGRDCRVFGSSGTGRFQDAPGEWAGLERRYSVLTWHETPAVKHYFLQRRVTSVQNSAPRWGK